METSLIRFDNKAHAFFTDEQFVRMSAAGVERITLEQGLFEPGWTVQFRGSGTSLVDRMTPEAVVGRIEEIGIKNAQAALNMSRSGAIAKLPPSGIDRVPTAARYLCETSDGRLLYLNHADEWCECPNFIADIRKEREDHVAEKAVLNQRIISLQHVLMRVANSAEREGLRSEATRALAHEGRHVSTLTMAYFDLLDRLKKGFGIRELDHQAKDELGNLFEALGRPERPVPMNDYGKPQEQPEKEKPWDSMGGVLRHFLGKGPGA